MSTFSSNSSLDSCIGAGYISEEANDSDSEYKVSGTTHVQPSQREEFLQPLPPLEPLKASIKAAACSLGYEKLKLEQEESILLIVKGTDVFVSLPTGYSKSICYIVLPSLFDILRKVERKSIVLVVPPLIALMRDQVAFTTAMGITATYISDKDDVGRKQAIKNGEFQIIFISPEALILLKWRNILSTRVYRDNFVAFVVDEAHCIQKWYANKREGCIHVNKLSFFYV